MTNDNRKRPLRHLTLTSMVALMLGAAPAHAADKSVQLTIVAQSLSDALVDFSKKTKIAVLTSGAEDALEKLRNKKIDGTYAPQKALEMLLENSGLSFEFKGDNTVIIRKKAATKPTGNDLSSINGHVTELHTGTNLAGALIRIEETGQTTTTNDLGRFHFPGIAPGNYTLSISYLGYASLVTEIPLGRGEEFKSDFSLGKPLGALDEIVVFGSRSARATSLNLQRTAENNADIISADTLGNFTGTTISEALRRVPGVAFQRDPLTGDGTNIMIRGLAPDMNAVKLNGLHLPVGNGTGRSADLGNLLADSISRITIHKSLLPNHDSAGTGGLVEIETKSPLNRPHRYVNVRVEGDKKGGDFGDGFLLSGTVAGTFGSDDNFGLSASVQYRERNIRNYSYDAGLEFGTYFPLDEEGNTSISSRSVVHPLTPFPFEGGDAEAYPYSVDSNFSEVETSTVAITLSGEWQVDDHTNLKFDMTRSSDTKTSFSRSGFFDAALDYSLQPVVALGGEERQILGWSIGSDQCGGDAYCTNLQQVYSFSKNVKNVTDTYSFRGDSIYGKWEFGYGLGYVHGTSVTPKTGRFAISYGLDGGFVLFDPSFVTDGAIDPTEGRIISPFAKRSGDGYPLPLLNAAGWASVNDSSNYQLDPFPGGLRGSEGSNDRYTAKLNAKYNVDSSYLKYIEVGVNFESAKFKNANLEERTFTANCVYDYDYYTYATTDTCASVAELGLVFEPTDLSAIGFEGQGFNYLSRESFEGFLEGFESLNGGALDTQFVTPHPDEAKRFTKETSLAAYLQTRIDIGKLEIIGGVRLSHVKVQAVNRVFPFFRHESFVVDEDFAEEFAVLRDEQVTQTDILPRFQFNYRQTDDLIFRASYTMSTARPQISQLSAVQNFMLDLRPIFGTGDQPRLSVTEGNPDLKPATTHNFGLGFEYYHDQIGVIRLSGFYKSIRNVLEINEIVDNNILDGVVLPAFPFADGESTDGTLEGVEDLFLSRRRPGNGAHGASVWGFELALERQFTFLPGFWNGFGIYANYTYTKSNRRRTDVWSFSPLLDPDGNTQPAQVVTGFDPMTGDFIFGDDPSGAILRGPADIDIPSARLGGQVSSSGTVALTYNKHDIDAALTYGFQGSSQGEFVPHNLSQFNGSIQTLDFRISYYFEAGAGQYRVFFEGVDLLKSSRTPDLQNSVGGVGSTPRYYTGASFIGGRTLRLGLSASF